MPEVPPCKNRTDHGVALCSSVSDVAGHAHTQVHVQIKTQKCTANNTCMIRNQYIFGENGKKTGLKSVKTKFKKSISPLAVPF